MSYFDLMPLEARDWMRAKALVVDVREPHEYSGGHLSQATNIPLSQIANRLAEIPKDQRVLLVCASGGRSGTAAEFLLSQGFEGARIGNLLGGTLGWVQAGMAIER